ncbi:hypothetical protein BDZ94DRAFT_1176523 [Collybia nuda]|uniref:Uncharacterized protein n=1 Tax=Collybia nuda TaxID=64659 RepID=A0A9P6CDE8_9AGAR|nr:hypothetical protein BDZ94DRAFT_1176523 [Collybia nuda]
MVSWPLLIVILSFICAPTQALVTNYTIDDSSPDPRTGNSIVYSPDTSWNSATLCQGAGGPSSCNAQPDKSAVSGGTWHECTFMREKNNFPLTATVQFEGIAVYVYCVLAPESTFGISDMTFTLDGEDMDQFTQEAPADVDYQYNVLVFSRFALSPGSHELKISNGKLNAKKSFIILDRIIYS